MVTKINAVHGSAAFPAPAGHPSNTLSS